ncbi:DNA-directed DNA polymerase [Melia azedarach]|uniref:DNA-directed DNA polymerase n=1 Tax=Melia azedarach TaxID=155640 RepID=A0ACC1YIW1_MELAZ|nr:DNA-directed DNA polymerase [Melia azedarach]
MESLSEAWERYKDMLRRCSHHGLPSWLQVQTFYNGLSCTTRTMIDAAAGGALMSKTPDEAYQLLEEMASNNYQWPSDRSTQRKVVGVHEIDAITTLTAQVTTLSRQLGTLNVNAIQSRVQVCELCGGNHASVNCQVGSPFASSSSEQANFVSNFQRHQQNAYLNTYNPAWKHHPKFSWSNDQNFMKPPPSFQPQEKKVNLEDALAQLTMNTSKFMTKTETTLQNQAASIRNLEVQVGQLASMMTERQQRSLPSNTETNPREHVNAITLQSGKKLEEPKDKMKEQKREQHESSSSNQAKTEEETKEWHDRKAFGKHFAPGYRVLLFNWRSRLFLGKPKTRWLGPFTVVWVLLYGAVEINHETKGIFKVNGQRLKHYMDNEFEQCKTIINLEKL